MNHLLAAYYGTAPVAKVSEVQQHETLALRELFVRLGGLPSFEKLSSEATRRPVIHSLVQTLGGPEEAHTKLSQSAEWMEAWDQGEQDGRRLATSAMKDLVSLHARTRH